jgi:hypothetical protein
MSTRFFVLLISAVVCLHAQSEGALRQAFEGKTVRVKMDLPATSDGVDIQHRGEPPLDFRSYSQRIKRFGVSLRSGDSVMVTTVRVKGKNIEFQLGGGGYGTLGDPSSNVSLGTVSKSQREQDLEREIQNEPNATRRSQMSRELARMVADRERENGDRRAREVELTALRQREIEEKRLQAGSRFNLRFPDNYLKESVPTPQELRAMLAEYVAFDGVAGSGEAAMPRSTRVRKGMTMEEVYGVLGEPSDTARSPLGEFEQVTATWVQSGGATKVTFINGVAVKFSVQGG